jgi:hypoxanthine phosphoribosyltransferase
MYNKNPVITSERYLKDMYTLSNRIKLEKIDCLICLKRSGFILGAFLSNQLTIPLFTTSEIKSIPNNFTSVLIIDDKVCTGKSLNHIKHKINNKSTIKTACMYVEADYCPDIWVSKLEQIHKMWYEKL